MLAEFSEHPDLAWTLDGIAGRYEKAKKYDEARSIYQKIVTDYNETDYAFTAQKKIAILEITVGDDAAAQAALDILIADFNDNPDLPIAILEIGEKYYNIALRNKNKGLASESEENFQKANAVWERIIKELPPSLIIPEAYFLSAESFCELDEQVKAAEYYQKVVDNWPNFKYSWHSQYLVARIYNNLKRSGAMPESEANPKIKAAYERILQDYPDSSAVHDARKWFNRHKDLTQGEEK